MLRAVAIALLSGVTAVVAKPPEHSLSPSAQFVIYGEDAAARGAVSALAEKTKANLLSVLHLSDAWKTPIIVNLQPTQANVPELLPVYLRFSQTGFGLKIQLDLTIGTAWDRGVIERELLRALLLEMMYRNEPNLAAGTAYVEPPAWLIDGLLASAPGHDRDSLVQALDAAGSVTPLKDFLTQRVDQLDSPGRQLYRGYAFAIVQLLLQRENGRALAQYINSLPHGSNDAAADLRRQFPELTGADANSVWKSEVARVKLELDHQLFTFDETNRQLQSLVASKPSLHDMAQRKLSTADKTALVRLKFELLLLASRANPILRPTVQDYAQVTVALLTGKKRGIVRQLGEIEDLCQRVAARMTQIDDYMNWMEATKLTRQSGIFENYVTAVKEHSELASHRRDPLSVYLDALEEQF